jgi:4-hydroxy-tetrahydrodipicolinate reductase
LVVSDTVSEALATRCDVFIDYTHPTAVKAHVLEAIRRKVPVVIGTSGLTESDFQEIDDQAKQHGIGVIAAGNFALTAVLLQRFAVMAAKYLPHWEVIDYATAEKPDAPSGTARELAAKLGQVRTPETGHPVEKTIGIKEARGGNVRGTQIHSVRLPGFVFSFEILFGLPNERLLLRHDAGSSPEPYVHGTLLAAERVRTLVGLVRGLESLLDS